MKDEGGWEKKESSEEEGMCVWARESEKQERDNSKIYITPSPFDSEGCFVGSVCLVVLSCFIYHNNLSFPLKATGAKEALFVVTSVKHEKSGQALSRCSVVCPDLCSVVRIENEPGAVAKSLI